MAASSKFALTLAPDVHIRPWISGRTRTSVLAARLTSCSIFLAENSNKSIFFFITILLFSVYFSTRLRNGHDPYDTRCEETPNDIILYAFDRDFLTAPDPCRLETEIVLNSRWSQDDDKNRDSRKQFRIHPKRVLNVFVSKLRSTYGRFECSTERSAGRRTGGLIERKTVAASSRGGMGVAQEGIRDFQRFSVAPPQN